MKKRKQKLIESNGFTRGIMKPMILENLKQYVLLVIILEIVLLIWVLQMINRTIWQSILENLKVKQDRNLKRVKEAVLNSIMTLLKGTKLVYRPFRNGIFLKTKKVQQLEQSEQWSSDDKYTSLKLDNDLNTSSVSSSSDSDILLFTTKKGIGLKILNPKQMTQR